jgi:hypothetical protein
VISLGIDDKTVRRIRDVYRWSWFLSITDPGSRGSKRQRIPDPQHWLKAGLHIRTLWFFNFFQIRPNVQYFIGSGYATMLLT